MWNYMWKSMSIKKKLILAFMMIGLFSAIAGIFGIGAIYSTNSNTNEIYSGHFVPATYLFNIQIKGISLKSKTR